MQKWEYLTISFGVGQYLKIDKFWENGIEKRLTNKNQLRFEILNNYGALGWEMVAKDEWTYLFKRPI